VPCESLGKLGQHASFGKVGNKRATIRVKVSEDTGTRLVFEVVGGRSLLAILFVMRIVDPCLSRNPKVYFHHLRRFSVDSARRLRQWE
jgi:hypothetical protein